MSGVTIRPARPRDVPGILEHIRELAEFERERDSVEATEAGLAAALFGEQPHAFAHVAVVTEGEGPEESIAGIAVWFLTFSTWTGRHGIWLEDLHVRPEHRGAGIGRRLLAALAAICVSRGYRRLEWSVLDWNEPARGFYKSIGARELDDWITNRVEGDLLRRLGGDEDVQETVELRP